LALLPITITADAFTTTIVIVTTIVTTATQSLSWHHDYRHPFTITVIITIIYISNSIADIHHYRQYRDGCYCCHYYYYTTYLGMLYDIEHSGYINHSNAN